MKHFKGLATWLSVFTLGAALIAVYKTFDNMGDIWSFLWRFVDILTPFVIGFALAFLLYAPTRKLESVLKKAKRKIVYSHARMIAIGIVYLCVLILLALIMVFALPALFRGIVDFVKTLPGYYEKAIAFLERFTKEGGLLESFDITEKLNEFYNYLLSYFTAEKVTAYLMNVISFTTSLLDIFMALIISVYMLASREALIRAVKSVFGLFMKERWIAACSDYGHRIAKIFYGYFYSQVLDACIVGIIITIGLWIIGVPSAPLLGMLVGLMNMIPYFGAIIAGCFCVLITLLSGNVYQAIFVAVYILVMQQIDGNIIQPRIVGNSLGVRPIYVLLAITVGGGFFGFWGIFLGVPCMAVLQMLISNLIAYRHKKRLAAESGDPAAPEPPDVSE